MNESKTRDQTNDFHSFFVCKNVQNAHKNTQYDIHIYAYTSSRNKDEIKKCIKKKHNVLTFFFFFVEFLFLCIRILF